MITSGYETLALLGLAADCRSGAGNTCCMHNRAVGPIGLNSPSTEQVASFDVGIAGVNSSTASYQVARMRYAVTYFDGLRAWLPLCCGPG
jgi:hypothetical protein